jgi:hypothetical protein
LSCLSFKKDAKVYVVYGGSQYRLDVSEITFGQTFTEHSYSNKSIQVQNMFEQSVINKANPANFSLTFPVIREVDLEVLFNRALDYQSFDLYVETLDAVFGITGCVIFNTSFVLEKSRALQLTVSGEGVKVSYLGVYGVAVIPGTPVARTGTRTYNKLSYINLVLNGSVLTEPLNSISLELNNDISWTPYTTATHALDAINAGTSMYPQLYTMSKRQLGGTFSMYEIDAPTWGVNNTLLLEVGQKDGSTLYGFKLDLSNVSFQRNVETGDIFKQRYSWRLTENPAALADIITYEGL